MKLRRVQVAIAGRLRDALGPEPVPVFLEVGGRVAGMDRLAMRAGGGAVVVHEPAFLLNTAAGSPPPEPGQSLDGEALVTVSCWWRRSGVRVQEAAEWREESGEGGALDLAEAVLLGLHRWQNPGAGVGRMTAERQALMPAPGSGQLMHYVPRNAKGGEERFRAMAQSLRPQDWNGGCYVVNFELTLTLGGES